MMLYVLTKSKSHIVALEASTLFHDTFEDVPRVEAINAVFFYMFLVPVLLESRFINHDCSAWLKEIIAILAKITRFSKHSASCPMSVIQ